MTKEHVIKKVKLFISIENMWIYLLHLYQDVLSKYPFLSNLTEDIATHNSSKMYMFFGKYISEEFYTL